MPITYIVHMRALPGSEDAVEELLVSNADRIQVALLLWWPVPV